jgi:DNA-binding response OmpR family regulator
LETYKDNVRGLITDINLGKGPDGWDVARHARELIPALPVVYMSGASAHEWTSHGVPHSVFIAKPFAPAQVVTAISTLLNASDSSP